MTTIGRKIVDRLRQFTEWLESSPGDQLAPFALPILLEGTCSGAELRRRCRDAGYRISQARFYVAMRDLQDEGFVILDYRVKRFRGGRTVEPLYTLTEAGFERGELLAPPNPAASAEVPPAGDSPAD
jgi:DNA-binding PadR family transcriptional regulator